MQAGRRVAVTFAVAAFMLAAAPSARGQQSPEPPSDVPVQIGPLAVVPVVRLTNVGHDSNVYNRNLDGNPQGDITAKLSPVVDAWLRLPLVRVAGRSQFDFYYFKELTELRTVDTDTAARLEVLLNRLTPYVMGTFTNTRHRQSLEIDALAQRQNGSVTAGAEMRVASKISAGAYARRSRLDYEANSLYLGTDLSRVLNHTSYAEGVTLRYDVTPFTTFAVSGERQRDRFDFAEDRDADGLVVQSSVELNPLALISGRASLGYRKSSFLSGEAPDFNGTVGVADLSYTLLGRTRFTVRYGRELKYSYLVEQFDYVETAVSLSVAHRIGEAWNVGGNASRGRLAYRRDNVATASLAYLLDETLFSYGADVSYSTGRTTIGLLLEHLARHADLAARSRGYERLRIGSTLTYAF
jgi:hypothetical protein